MSALVASVAQAVDDDGRTNKCKKGKCSISLNDAPAQRLIVDLDCATLPIPANQKCCDYLLIGEQDSTDWVVPIELKGGDFKVDDVAEQLQGGSNVANAWLPLGSPFRFVPVLAHRGVHKHDRDKLRYKQINLRGQGKRIKLLRCGEKLIKALS